MPQGVNKVFLVGYVGGDPRINAMPSGSTVANFSLATSERWSDKAGGPSRSHTEWHRVVAFGRIAETVRQSVRKGMQLYLEGSLRTRKWQDKNDQERLTTEIVLKELLIVGGASDAADEPQDTSKDIPW